MTRIILPPAIAFAVALAGIAGSARAQSSDPTPSTDAAAETSATTTDVAAQADAATTSSSTQATQNESGTSTQPSVGTRTNATAPADTSTQNQIANPSQTQTTTQGQAQIGTQSSSAQTTTQGSAARPGQALPQGAAQFQLGTTPQPGTSPQIDVNQQSTQQPNQHPNQQTGAAQSSANLRTSAAAENLNLGLQFGVATARGLTINSVDRGSFLFASGLQPADVLVSVAGQPVRSLVEFQRFVALYPNQRIPLIVLRGGQRETIYITPPMTEKSVIARAPAQTQSVETPSVLSVPLLGVTFDAQFPSAAIVRIVDQGGPAERAGIRPGDMILALDRIPVSTPQDVAQVVRQTQVGQQIGIDYSRRVQAHAEATLSTESNAPRPYTAAYAPQAQSVTTPPAVSTTVVPRPVVPAPVVAPAPGVFPAPGIVPAPLNVRPGDPNANGRPFDGDGRLPRRAARRY